MLTGTKSITYEAITVLKFIREMQWPVKEIRNYCDDKETDTPKATEWPGTAVST